MANNFEPLTKELLITEADKIAKFADSNLEQLNGLGQEKELVQDYYLGMIRRQAIILNDIVTILAHTPHHNFSIVLILCRCLLDDFLTVFYLKLNDNETNNIIRINSDEHRQLFKTIEIIMQSNHLHFNGQNPYYLTENQLAALKKEFIEKPENDKYFIDKNDFRFKKFIPLSEVATGINDFELSKLSQRAFYFWKDLSGFVHYSNVTFEKELNTENYEYNLIVVEEVLLYSFNTIELSFRYFSEKYGNALIVDDDLRNRYIIEYED